MTKPIDENAALMARKKAAGLAAGPMTDAEAVSFAARQMAKRRVETAKPGELAALGRKGAAAGWAKYSDPLERALEVRRRVAVRRANRRKRIKAAIEGQK